MHPVLERHSVQNSDKDMSRPISMKKTESIINKLPKHLRKKLYYFSTITSSKQKQREHFLTFYEANITLLPKSDKDITSKENYKL